VDRALGEGFGYHDLEFVWQESNDLDALTQAQIAQVYLAAGVLTPQEVRASLGLGNDQKGGAISAVPLPKGGAANAGRPFGKYSDDQPRDYHGRWTSGDDGGEKEDEKLGGQTASPQDGEKKSEPQAIQPTEKMQQAVNGVNPSDGKLNCFSIAQAAIARLTGDNPNAISGNENGFQLGEAQQSLGTKFITTDGVEGAYNFVKRGGDGTIAVMVIPAPVSGGIGHIVTLYNDNGVVGFLEAQNQGKDQSAGVITDVNVAKQRYTGGLHLKVMIGAISKKWWQ